MKAESRMRGKRVLFLSWVPDTSRFSQCCVDQFREHLRAIPCDDAHTPLEVCESPISGVAGDAVTLESLRRATDFVGVFCPAYINAMSADPDSSEVAFAVERHQHERDDNQADPLTLWSAPVARMTLSRYTILAGTLERWHELLRQKKEKFSIGKDQDSELCDEVYEAVECMLAHTVGSCSQGRCFTDFPPVRPGTGANTRWPTLPRMLRILRRHRSERS